MTACYRLVCSYQGTGYLGWQVQPDSLRTIQGQLHRALEKVFKSTEIKSQGSGRTDAGVHAIGQVVKVTVPFSIEEKKLPLALNAHLPPEIRILESQSCSPEFHPIRDAQKKEYQYLFSNLTRPSLFGREFMANCPFELDLQVMEKACSLFLGEHDFHNFFCTGTEVSSTLRHIYSCTLEQRAGYNGLLDSHYCFKVEGSGFLKQMVRLMVGAVWSVGRGKASLSDLEESLKSGSKSLKIGAVAPPEGLYLVKVFYP